MTRRAFTILEVTLVLAVMILIAAITFPSIDAMYGDVKLTAAADQIRARWADARTQSIEEGRAYRFAIRDDGRYRIAPDSSEFWSAAATADGHIPNDTDTPPLDVEESLPKGVKFSDGGLANNDEPNDAAGWVTVVRFQPDGTATKDVEIVFEADNSRPLQLKLRGLTGAVTTGRIQ